MRVLGQVLPTMMVFGSRFMFHTCVHVSGSSNEAWF
jgi:hypothetical protein